MLWLALACTNKPSDSPTLDSVGPADSDVPLETWFRDGDGDGFGVDDDTTEASSKPSGFAAVAGDCDDTDPAINPDAEEVCEDGLDNDCDDQPEPQCRLEGTTSLSDADIKILGPGEETDEYFGYALEFVDDLTGDGVDDLLVMGVLSYVVPNPGGGVIHIDSPATSWTEGNGTRVALRDGVGDIDGDGFGDVASAVYPEDGVAHLGIHFGPVFGLLAKPDFRVKDALVTGEDFSCTRPVPVGDFGGDGHDDLAMSCYSWWKGGAVAIVTGPVTAAVSLDDRSLFVTSARESSIGYRGSQARDVDGDGLRDLVVSDPRNDNSPGLFVIHGPASGWLVAGDGAGGSGDEDLRLVGGEYSGWRPSAHGDTDGDGYTDIVAGSPYTGFEDYGNIYIVSGDSTGRMTFTEAASSTVEGNNAGFYAGFYFDVGDLDGDGFGDIALTSRTEDDPDGDGGTVYLLYGPISGTISIDDADAFFDAESDGDLLGEVAVGDFNGDAFDDLAVRSAWNDEGGPKAGAVYLFWGGGG
ncbi:MAG TPA: FG-GAP-like repeat-containing protein [Myxococcota bacterium]|nr:FG-GAP-like repeat-containing protein [Myxococcota bacterium]